MRALLLCTAVALLVGGTAPAAPRRSVVDLGTLGGNASVALAVNASGTVVGTSRVRGNAATHAFVYRDGTMRDLGVLPGFENSAATAINDGGAIVGRAWSDDAASLAFRVDGDALVALPATAAGRRLVGAVGISASGTVAAAAADRGAAEEQVASVTQDAISTPVAGPAVPGGIGPTGDIVGTHVDPAGTSQAFLYRRGTLSTLGGGTSVAAAANARGEVAGWARASGAGAAHAFLYSAGRRRELGLPAGTESEARALNGNGQVVGDFFDTADGRSHAFLWENGVAVDLNDLVDPAGGWVLEQATGINDDGAIVGVGTHDGATRAFLLPGPGARATAAAPTRMETSRTTAFPGRTPAAARADPSLTIVSQNASVAAEAADSAGYLYSTSGVDLLRSADEGRTWVRVHSFPPGAVVHHIAPLASGTLLASIDTGATTVWRSADHGATWTRVLTLPSAPDFMRTLTAHSFADGGSSVWVGTYVDRSTTGTNYVYRSTDDGATWSVANTTTTHRHIHGVRYNAGNGRLYVLFGDSDGDGIWQSSDEGSSLSRLCSSFACIAVDMTFDASGSYGYFGQDHRWDTRAIERLDLGSGATTSLLSLSWSSFSAFRVGDTILIGTHRESGDTSDTQLHLYASDDGSRFVDVYRAPIAYANGEEGLRVMSALPNGDFPIIVDGYGTTVARLGDANAPPVNTDLPAITGTTAQGETLTATAGMWTGSPTAYAYEWRRCDASGGGCAAIPFATSAAYVANTGDVGSTLRVAVTATNAVGSASAVSLPTAVVIGGGQGSFGQSQVGSSFDSAAGGYLDVSGPFVVSAAVTVTRLNAYLAGGSASSTVRGIVYRDSGGQPGTFVAVTKPLTTPAGAAAGWAQLSFVSPVALPAGSYWLGYWYADGSGRHYYVRKDGSERYRAAAYSATADPPAAFGSAASAYSNYSFTASYTAP